MRLIFMEPASQTNLLKFIFVSLSGYLLFAFCSANASHFNAVFTGKLTDPLNGTYSARSFATDDGTEYTVNFDFFWLNYNYDNVTIERDWSCGGTRSQLGSGVPEKLATKILLHDPNNPKTTIGELKILPDNKLSFRTMISDEELGGQWITLIFEKD